MLERNRHFTRVLVLVVLVALALRVWGLTTQSLWYDEGFSVNLAGQSWGRILLGELNLPPLYHLLLGAWVRLAGSGEFAVRYFSVFWGVLLVVLGGAWVSRLLGPRAGALCALLLAMSPIEVWYAQETRMYAMLGALALASSYLLTCLLAPPLRSNDLSRSSLTAEAVTTRGGWLWALYALVNIAAVYTHYYAALVLAAQAVWLLLHLVRTRDWRPARAWLLAQAALGLALLPWLPVFWGQWQAANTTYWPGRLSLGFVAGRAMLGFAGAGLTVADSAALGLALPLAALAALGLLVGLARPRWRWGTLCLLVYLLVPLALFYALVRDRPKFSPRYLLPIVPPLLALAAGALAALWPASLRDRRGWARSGLAVLLAVGTVVGSAAAAGNAQRDAAYGRDDLRGVAAFLTQAAAADEAVILVSGHLEPAFTYYYRGANCFPIPPRYTPSPSVDDVLTPAAFEDLNRAIVGRRGAWLVLWQDNVVDPNGVVLTALELAAHEAADAPAFRGVELHHFVFPLGLQLQPEMFAQHPLGVTIGDGELALVGCTLPSDPVPAGTSASAVLLWQTVRPVPHDYRLSLRMIDGQGQERVREDSRLGGYMYPTDHWRPGLQVVGSHRVPLPLSLPPGEYALQATIYRIGDRASQTVPLGNFRVGRALRQPTARELGIDRPLGLIFGELEVMGSRLAPSEATLGQTVYLTLFCSAREHPRERYRLAVWLDGERWAGLDLPASTVDMEPGDVFELQYPLVVPHAAPAGLQPVAVTLEGATGQAVAAAQAVSELTVSIAARIFEVPAGIRNPLRFTLGDQVAFLGYDLEPSVARMGDVLYLTLYWRGLRTMDTSYTVFTHVLDSQNKIWGQVDRIPVETTRPTTGWLVGEAFIDPYAIPLRADTPPGMYAIEVGLYDVVSGARLAVHDEQGRRVADDRILLGALEVRWPGPAQATPAPARP